MLLKPSESFLKFGLLFCWQPRELYSFLPCDCGLSFALWPCQVLFYSYESILLGTCILWIVVSSQWLETEYYFKGARRHVFLGAQGLVIVKTGNDTVQWLERCQDPDPNIIILIIFVKHVCPYIYLFIFYNNSVRSELKSLPFCKFQKGTFFF